MNQSSIGFHEEPKNGHGIVRCRTSQQIFSWDIPKKQDALEAFNTEIDESEFPGVYILLAKNRAYVGEAKNLYGRLKQHMAPDTELKDWNRAIMINDGRSAAQSFFNDTVVRRTLELYLGRLLKANKYNVVSHGETLSLTATQRNTADCLILELNSLLMKKNIITKLIEKLGQEQIFKDELKEIIERAGKKVSKLGASEGVIDGQKAFIRPGSDKPRGWQITIRGGKPGSFIDSFRHGKGFLLVARDGVPLVPLSEVQKVVKDKKAYARDTIDIWVTFEDDKVTLSYKENILDITEFKLSNKS